MRVSRKFRLFVKAIQSDFLIVLVFRPSHGRLFVDHVNEIFEVVLIFFSESADVGAVNIENSSHLPSFIKAWHDDLRPSEVITGDIVSELLGVERNEGTLLRTALATLTGTHVDFTAWENVRVADVFANENLCVIIRLLVVEANEAELITENFRQDLAKTELLLYLCCFSRDIKEGDPSAFGFAILLDFTLSGTIVEFVARHFLLCRINHFLRIFIF